MFSLKQITDKDKEESVVVLGFFDGVHRGHKRLIEKAREKASELSLPLAIFTFSSLPTKYGSDFRILTEDERDGVLAELGVDKIYTANFAAVKDMSAEEFVKTVLIDKLHTRVAFSGSDFRFGMGARGSFCDLKAEMIKNGADAFCIDEVVVSGEKISSSKIKELLKRGFIREANALLTLPYFLDGTVVKGRGVGKSLGFPTVNCDIPSEKAILKNGVYRTKIICGEESYDALTNVGACPTFEERQIHAESFLLDFDGDFYTKRVRIVFLDFLREEVKFENHNMLIEQIKKDVQTSKGLICQENGQSSQQP